MIYVYIDLTWRHHWNDVCLIHPQIMIVPKWFEVTELFVYTCIYIYIYLICIFLDAACTL